MKLIYIVLVLSIIGLLSMSLKSLDEKQENKIYIKLPTNYKMIDSTVAIVAYFDKDSVLHIDLDNRIQFEWEGMESDIPEDGNRMLNLSTNENTVYLNPVDE